MLARLLVMAVLASVSACGAASGGLRRVTLYRDGIAHIERRTSGDGLDAETDQIAPGWRPSYRLEIGADGEAHLDMLASIESPTSEPWTDVALVLGTRTPPRGSAAALLSRLDVDGDGLGILDDQCPDEGEDIDGFEDEDGCPETDNDGDRILDPDDACPNEPERYNGAADEDGCPDRGPVLLIDLEIRVLDQIYFDARSAVLRPRNTPILDAVAATLEGNPQILRIQVVGHASAEEPEPWALSAERAAAVRGALLARGLDPARIVVLPQGARIPSDTGREGNRRVGFEVLEVARAEPIRSTPLFVAAPPVPPDVRTFEIAGPTSLASHTRIDVLVWHLPAEVTAVLRHDPTDHDPTDVLRHDPPDVASPSSALSIRVDREHALLEGEVVVVRAGMPNATGVLHAVSATGAAEILFAPDTASTVTVASSGELEPSRVLSIRGAQLELEDLWVTRTTYTVTRGPDAPATFRLHHPRRRGTTPRGLPPTAEVTLDRVMLTVPLSDATTTIVVEDVAIETREVSVTNLSVAELAAYQRGSEAETRAALDPAAAALAALDTTRAALEVTRGALSDLTVHIASLRSTLREASARERGAARTALGDAVTQCEALAAELAQQQASIAARTAALLGPAP